MKKALKYLGNGVRRILRLSLGTSLVLSLVLGLLVGGALRSMEVLPVIYPIARDIIVATIAHAMSGPPQPFKEGEIDIDPTDTHMVWNTVTNSTAVTRTAYQIVPFFAMEGVSEGNKYPYAILVAPLEAERSFVMAGSAGDGIVYLNERVFLDESVKGRGDYFATLVHELIHIQGGRFLNPPPGVEGMERSYYIESRTQSATVEVLAAMCRYNYEEACQAFWGDMEFFARRSAQAKAMRGNVLWLYEAWSNLAFRNDAQDLIGEKMDRFWRSARTEQQQVVERYGELPWNEQVIPGICGKPLDSGNRKLLGLTPEGQSVFLVLTVDFDDTRLQLGPALTFLLCGSI